MTEHSGLMIERIRAGDRSAMGQLLNRHLPGLRAFVRLNMGPALRAKESGGDIAQSACRNVIENLEGFEYQGETAFRVYLFTTALRNIVSKRRHYLAAKRDVEREVALHPDLVDCYRSLSSPSQQLIEREEIERLEQAFDELTPDEREVVSLRRMFGLSSGEIAEKVGRDPSTVRRTLGRAVARLGYRLRVEPE